MKQEKYRILVRLISGFLCMWPIILYGDTALFFFRPFAESQHHPALNVQRTLRGLCREQSHAIKREDAWRCYADGKVYDPCFVKQYGSQEEAVCAESPWSEKGIKIALEYPVDNATHKTLDMSRTLPWAIELQNGERCLPHDSDEVIDGLAIRYKCNNEALLIGHLQRCKTTWSMLEHKSGRSNTVEIANAWF